MPGAPPTLTTSNGAGTAKTLAQVKAQAKQVASKIIQSKVLTALIVFLVTVLLLIAVNPPMAQEPRSDEQVAAGERGARSWRKILVWSLLVFALALLVPVAVSFCKPSGGDGASAACVVE